MREDDAVGILRHLVCKALTASNLTGPATYRVVEAFAPTLLLDEADTFLTDEKSELRGILNSSHSRTAAFVPRCVGDSHEVKLFSTWCAKAIALIGALPATLQDRAVALQLERRRKKEPVERRRADRNADLDELCRKTARWAADNSYVLRERDPSCLTTWTIGPLTTGARCW